MSIIKYLIWFIIIKNNLIRKKEDLCVRICTNNYNHETVVFKLKNVKYTGIIYDQIDTCILQCHNKFKEDKEFNKNRFNIKYKNICTNGKDNIKMTNKEYLLEFVKGPCSPAIIIPGIFGSKIEISINNCENFKKNYNNIYKTCGFGDCGTFNGPSKLYKLYLPDIFSPMTIFSFIRKYTRCFSRFMEVIFEFDDSINDYKIINKEGLEIRVLGTDSNNGKKGNCGVDAIKDYAPVELIMPETYGFRYIFDNLIQMGYRNGLTFQALPYDFRLSLKDNDLNMLFKENVERLNKLTNKKLISICHSLGNNNFSYQIKSNPSMSKLFGNFISIAPPILGSSKTIFTLIGSLEDMYFHGLGLVKDDYLIEMNSLKSIFEMIPSDVENFKDEGWFNYVKNRIEHEVFKEKDSYKKEGVNLLPNVNEICYNNYYKLYDYCSYNLQNSFDSFTLIKDKNYFLNDIKTFFLKYNKSKIGNKLLKSLGKDSIDLFNFNPKIPTTFIFINSIPTLGKAEYYRDIIEEINKNKYIKIDKNYYHNGDGTVNNWSIILKAYKQAYEFDKNINEGNHPIKLIELCSKVKNYTKNNYYDINDGKINKFTKNEYYGSGCDCNKSETLDKCNHSRLIVDTYLLEIISKLVQLEEKIDINKYKNYLKTLDEEQLNKYQTDCPQFRYIGYKRR